MIASRLVVGRVVIAALICLGVMTTSAQAQGRGGGRGGGSASIDTSLRTRLDILTDDFVLKKEQRQQVKGILDEAHKGAASVRDQLASARAAIAAAIQAGKAQTDVDAAVKNYATQAAAMTMLEMKALAKVMQSLEKEQRANATAVESAFFLVRGMFLDAKKWDAVPEGRGY